MIDCAGDGQLESITLVDRATGRTEELAAAALFAMIGGEPHTQWLPEEIARDGGGYLITGNDLLEHEAYWECDRAPAALETSMPGVFAAGDVRDGSIKRVAAAVGEGAAVVRLVHEYLRNGEPERVAHAHGHPTHERT